MIFQYELPLNFRYQQDLSHNFYVLGIMQGHALGFLFDSPFEKDEFADQMDILKRKLCVDKKTYRKLTRQAKKKSYSDVTRPITDETRIEDLLGDCEMERKLEEFVRIVLQSGIKVDAEQITDEKVKELTVKVIDGMANPNKHLDEDSVLFETRNEMVDQSFRSP